MEETLKSLSMDYLNLLINGQAFSDVTFNVEAASCTPTAASSPRAASSSASFSAAPPPTIRRARRAPPGPPQPALPLRRLGLLPPRRGWLRGRRRGDAGRRDTGELGELRGVPASAAVPVQRAGVACAAEGEPRPGCGERGCWHTHCAAAVDLALDTLAAARSFGVEELALLTQKQLAGMVEKASIEDVMKVLMASRKQDLPPLWTTCSHLVAKSGLPPEVLAKHLPIDVVAKIDELRLKSSMSRRSPFLSHHHPHHPAGIEASAAELDDHHKIRRMRRALDSSDVELVKLMEVVKALLELGAADVNHPAGPAGKTPLHVAAEMVCPDMVAVLLDHHADPNVRTVDGVTPLDILRTLTSDFLFKGAVPGLAHIEPNKLRLCLELVQSAAMVMSREDAHTAVNAAPMYNESPGGAGGVYNAGGSNSSMVNLSLDNRMVYLNLGMDAQFGKMNDGSDGDDGGSRGHGGPSSLFSPMASHDKGWLLYYLLGKIMHARAASQEFQFLGHELR
ncbi:hypothetical protein GUJ93_ZPchr0001g31690 [Zizania palustris]|uniref:C2HC NPR-type domain-containing protein n=1 Tax=Zizania palustris TaxID=103762 RepID=A0A8J5V690_ZIZPA|nr:hypothetical protein GUJ93_ZPchr0001g31690 [Zizania palustris]